MVSTNDANVKNVSFGEHFMFLLGENCSVSPGLHIETSFLGVIKYQSVLKVFFPRYRYTVDLEKISRE